MSSERLGPSRYGRGHASGTRHIVFVRSLPLRAIYYQSFSDCAAHLSSDFHMSNYGSRDSATTDPASLGQGRRPSVPSILEAGHFYDRSEIVTGQALCLIATKIVVHWLTKRGDPSFRTLPPTVQNARAASVVSASIETYCYDTQLSASQPIAIFKLVLCAEILRKRLFSWDVSEAGDSCVSSRESIKAVNRIGFAPAPLWMFELAIRNSSSMVYAHHLIGSLALMSLANRFYLLPQYSPYARLGITMLLGGAGLHGAVVDAVTFITATLQPSRRRLLALRGLVATACIIRLATWTWMILFATRRGRDVVTTWSWSVIVSCHDIPRRYTDAFCYARRRWLVIPPILAFAIIPEPLTTLHLHRLTQRYAKSLQM